VSQIFGRLSTPIFKKFLNNNPIINPIIFLSLVKGIWDWTDFAGWDAIGASN
jgi:hypothetical protein